MPNLELMPITFRQAKAFIEEYHSHHKPPQGWKFGICVHDRAKDRIVGVVTVGRPVSRHMDDGFTAEVTRCCTDRTPHVASMLYAAAWRAAKAMGYKRIITYTLDEEKGTSLIAAGWHEVAASEGGSWSRKKRPREDKHPTGLKKRWMRTIGS
jgi:hypothetical protein